MIKKISGFILFKILGWKFEGDFPKDIKKYVVIAAPHTSWVDFPIAILSRMASGLMINFIGKNISQVLKILINNLFYIIIH